MYVLQFTRGKVIATNCPLPLSNISTTPHKNANYIAVHEAQTSCKHFCNQLVFLDSSRDDVIAGEQGSICRVTSSSLHFGFWIWFCHSWLLWHEKRRLLCDYNGCNHPHLCTQQSHHSFSVSDNRKCLHTKGKKKKKERKKEKNTFCCSCYHINQKSQLNTQRKNINRLLIMWFEGLDPGTPQHMQKIANSLTQLPSAKIVKAKLCSPPWKHTIICSSIISHLFVLHYFQSFSPNFFECSRSNTCRCHSMGT